MAKNTAGFLVEYKKKDGTTQKGIIRYSEQTAEVQKTGKKLVLLLKPNLQPMLDEKEKEQRALVSEGKCIVKGYVD